jgi:hypothetical protein
LVAGMGKQELVKLLFALELLSCGASFTPTRNYAALWLDLVRNSTLLSNWH